METLIQKLIPVLALAFGLVLGSAAGAEESIQFENSLIVVETGKGKFTLSVKLAKTKTQRSFGLQFRPHLEKNEGMLFDFRRDQQVIMWMKNTLISLDMVFLDSTGRVRNVIEGTVPMTLDYQPSQGKVRAVLEVNAGTVKHLGLKEGDFVHHSIFSKKLN